MRKMISLVIPVFNEEDSLKELSLQINRVLRVDFIEYGYEIIFVNDGSTDSSLEIIKNLRKKDTRVKVISFRKNLGKATALNQGFKKSRGGIILTMDADLQDDPKNIKSLINKLNEGNDLVAGWRKERFDPIGKKIVSGIFNFFVGKISRIPLHDFNCGLKIMRQSVAKELYLYGGLHRFIPVLAHQRGFKVSEVEVIHRPRKYGKSNYGKEKLIRGFLDFLTVMFLSGRVIGNSKTEDKLPIDYANSSPKSEPDLL